MARETMSSEERMWAAFRLEKPDRVPLVPNLTPVSCAHLLGWTQAKIASDQDAALDSMLRIYDEYGPFDAVNPSVCYDYLGMRLIGQKVKVPGKDLPEDMPWQMLEIELLKPEDYDVIADIGWNRFLREDFVFRADDDFKTQEDLYAAWRSEAAFITKSYVTWLKRGSLPMMGGGGSHPFFILSLARSMVKFTEDLYYQPERVEKALRRMTTDYIEGWIRACKRSGFNICGCVEERASAFYYPPRVFERFWWPYTKEMVDAIWSEGIVTWFHLDTPWDKNLPYFKELPRGSAVVALDGTTDIFAAKEVLRNHLCIAGDVQAALLSVGKPEEVEAYCKKLIDEVGGDGGFILASGCEVPYACKPENLRAMVETGRNYELSGR